MAMKDKNLLVVQAFVPSDLMDKIDNLASRLGVSRSRFCSLLLDNAVTDDEYIVRFVTSRFARPFVNAVKILFPSHKTEEILKGGEPADMLP